MHFLDGQKQRRMNHSSPAPSAADRLNRECFCIGTDVDALHDWLDADLERHGLAASVADTHPHLFSSLPVFVTQAHVQQMRAVIRAIETVVATQEYRQHALASAPAIAVAPTAARGVLQSYDFHLGSDGAKLIEINTNAGGAMLNAVMGRAQQACCREIADLIRGPSDYDTIEARLFDMFAAEWRRARGTAALQRIAIVDTAPRSQYLYPEFLLFRRLFESHGIAASIVDPSELQISGGVLRDAAGPIDLVYNRLTDFYFDKPEHAVLAQA
jgi:hypothetical protein